MATRSGSFTQLLVPDLLRVYQAERDASVDFAIGMIEGRAEQMGWVRKQEDKWALIGPVMCLRETAKALLVKFKDGDLWSETWVPKSMLHPEENEVAGTGHQGFLVIPEWLAREKGWIE